jgi:hypothetical protein
VIIQTSIGRSQVGQTFLSVQPKGASQFKRAKELSPLHADRHTDRYSIARSFFATEIVIS